MVARSESVVRISLGHENPWRFASGKTLPPRKRCTDLSGGARRDPSGGPGRASPPRPIPPDHGIGARRNVFYRTAQLSLLTYRKPVVRDPVSGLGGIQSRPLGRERGLETSNESPDGGWVPSPLQEEGPRLRGDSERVHHGVALPSLPFTVGTTPHPGPSSPSTRKYLLAAAKWAAHNAFSTPRIQSRFDLLGSSLFHFLFGKVPCTIFGLHFLESSTSLGDRWPFRSGVFIRGPVRAMAAA